MNMYSNGGGNPNILNRNTYIITLCEWLCVQLSQPISEPRQISLNTLELLGISCNLFVCHDTGNEIMTCALQFK